MVEVEIKLKVDSADLIEKKLVELGFKKGQTLQEIDYYYNGVDRDFRESGEALRLRLTESLDGSAIVADRPGEPLIQMTYKGPKLDKVSMSRVEHQVNIDDFETMQSILSSLGYKPVMPVIKLRRELFSEEMTACVDTVDGLGDYLELEIIVDEENQREDALNKIADVLNKMEYSISDTTTISYLSMLEMSNMD
ncbi:MAG: class IV adenylate cyclase [Saccharofermentans sp.]|nr:class IV adenylate cyclase [Saccharofermentans sp.]